MTLSPKQTAVLECLKHRGKRRLPEEAEDKLLLYYPLALLSSIYWAWSWQINQEAFTADYRRRIFELKEKGYVIESFQVGSRYGYALIREPQEEQVKPIEPEQVSLL